MSITCMLYTYGHVCVGGWDTYQLSAYSGLFHHVHWRRQKAAGM